MRYLELTKHADVAPARVGTIKVIPPRTVPDPCTDSPLLCLVLGLITS